MTTTPMKRAGQLIAHLDTLHQIRDVRQLLLLQLVMRERQDQVVLFKRQGEAATLSLIGSLIGAQVGPPAEQLSHRAGNVAAAVLMDQLQRASGIPGDEVAFSSGQIGMVVDAETLRIEQSEGLARLDAALLGLVGKLEQQESSEAQGGTVDFSETAESGESVPESETVQPVDVPDPQEGEIPEDASGEAELVADLPAGRAGRRRA